MLRVRRKMERERVTIEFGGPSEEVGVGAFAATVLGYAAVAQEAARLLNPSATVDVNVRAVRPGCVSVDVDVVTGLVEALRNMVACIAPMAPDIVATASELYRLKRELARGGGVAQIRQDGEGNVVVTTGSRSTVTVRAVTYNLHVSSPKAGRAVAETFRELGGDENVESVSFGAHAGGEVRVARDDFAAMAALAPDDTPATREVSEQNVRLAVVKPNLVMSADRKWGFTMSSGASISASISDAGFLKALPSLSFSLGTVMVVNLRKTQAYDSRLNIYVDRNDSYVITDVLGIERPSMTPEIPGFAEAHAQEET